MPRVFLIVLVGVWVTAAGWGSDPDRPSPFGPKPNGRGYEKGPAHTASASNKTAPAPEQQRARAAADNVTASNFVSSGGAETGKASYSGSELDGRKTASGEIFDSNSLTAAHHSLPMGSYVRVTSVSTTRSVVVRINDRCKATPNRVIQVSKRAAEDLGILGGSGGDTVKVEPVTAQARASR